MTLVGSQASPRRRKQRNTTEPLTGGRSSDGEEPPWMTGFGALSDLADENRLVLDAIEEEFERLSPEDAA